MGVTRGSHAVKAAGKESGKAPGRAGGASRAKWVLPFAASCLGLLLASLLMMPMLKMSPKDVPVGLLSLDAGVTVSGTQVNVGDVMVEQLTGEGGDADDEMADDAAGAAEDADGADDAADADVDAASALDGVSLFGGEESGTSSGYVTSDAVNWIVVDSEQELEALLDSGEVYAALTIPADFSERIAASAGRTALGTQLVERLPQLAEEASADPSVKLVINQGKNPMVSNSLGSAISSMASSSGVAFDIEYKNPLPTGMSMGFTHMILMMLTYLSSYVTAVVVSRTFELKRGGARQVLASVAAQVCYAAACALAIGFCAAGIISAATGAAVSFVDLALFVALASFAFQMLVLGALDLFGMAGMVVPIGLLVIGMGAAYLPTEFLPAFWQNWIYPWDPLRFMADGYRGIMYMGQGFWNASSPALLVMVAVGAALVALKVALDARGKAS